jgi:hypothetical protein
MMNFQNHLEAPSRATSLVSLCSHRKELITTHFDWITALSINTRVTVSICSEFSVDRFSVDPLDLANWHHLEILFADVCTWESLAGLTQRWQMTPKHRRMLRNSSATLLTRCEQGKCLARLFGLLIRGWRTGSQIRRGCRALQEGIRATQGETYLSLHRLSFLYFEANVY